MSRMYLLVCDCCGHKEEAIAGFAPTATVAISWPGQKAAMPQSLDLCKTCRDAVLATLRARGFDAQ